jgi:nicotinamidase-related amidase
MNDDPTSPMVDTPQSALLVVDLQRGTASLPTAHPVKTVISLTLRLVEAYRIRALPIAYIYSTGTPSGRTTYTAGARRLPDGWSDPLPELSPVDGDLLVFRSAWSAFANTDLDQRLRDRHVRQVVLVGLATSFGVESTARAAYDLGYDVVVVSDAVTDPRAAGHDNSVNAVFPVLGLVTTTQALLEAAQVSDEEAPAVDG